MSALYAQAYMMFGVSHGFDPDGLCSEAGFTMADVADRDSHIPYAWCHALLAGLIERLPNLSVGIEIGRFYRLEHLGYLGHALRNSATPLAALKLLMRNARLLDSAYHQGSEVVVSEDRVTALMPMLPDDLPEAIELGFVNMVTIGRDLIRDPGVREAHFGHRRDSVTQRQLEDVLGCPVRWEQARPALFFDRATMEQPMPGADPQAFAHFRAYVSRQLDQLDEPFVTVVERTIEAQIARNDLSQLNTAKILGLSVRSLQRSLQQHGVSYQQLVTRTRLTLAKRLLADQALAVYEVALALGYDEVSAFSRAFRQWTGQSPRHYRNAMATSD